MSDFGQRLKTIRKKRNVTQKELAESLQLAQSTVANYENNTRFPSVEPLTMISDYLNVSIDYLLGISESEEKDDLSDTLLGQDGDISLTTYQEIWQGIFSLLLEGKESLATQAVLSVYQKTADSIAMIENIYMPILREIGLRWESEKMSIVQEHFISHLVDRWMIMTSLPLGKNQKRLSALFVVPSAEEHTLVLKMIREYFNLAGWITYFIGGNFPISSLRQFAEELKVDLMVTSITLKSNINSAEHLIQSIRATKQGRSIKILVGGRGVSNEKEAKEFLGADYYLSEIENLKEVIGIIEKELNPSLVQ